MITYPPTCVLAVFLLSARAIVVEIISSPYPLPDLITSDVALCSVRHSAVRFSCVRRPFKSVSTCETSALTVAYVTTANELFYVSMLAAGLKLVRKYNSFLFHSNNALIGICKHAIQSI